MKKWLTSKLIYLLSPILIGAGLTFAFYPYNVFPLATVLPAFLLALWLNTSAKGAFWTGFYFGLGLFGAGIYWVYISIHQFGDVPIPLALFITASLTAILALFPATKGYLLNRYFPYSTPIKLICAFPAIWVSIEWVRSWLFSGFPWLFIGYSQTASPLRGLAPLLSVYGVSLACLIGSGLILNAYLSYRKKKYRSLYFSLLSLALIWIISGMLSYIPWTEATPTKIKVSLVQGNIPQALKWSPEHINLSLNTYTKLTESLWEKDRLIIWPEAAVPLSLQEANHFVEDLNNKAKESGATLILGIPIAVPNSTGYYNAVVSLGEKNEVYVKRRLVPYGEYTPFSQVLSRALNFMNIPMADMVPGKANQIPITFKNINILTSICFEVAFPELVNSQDASNGILLTVTNDAWFGNSIEQAQHLQMAMMRAIELRRPLMFVGNDGTTALITPDGKIDAIAPPHTATVLNGTVQPMNGLTPWMKNGMDPILFILICLLFIAVREVKILNNKNAQSVLSDQIKPDLTQI